MEHTSVAIQLPIGVCVGSFDPRQCNSNRDFLHTTGRPNAPPVKKEMTRNRRVPTMAGVSSRLGKNTKSVDDGSFCHHRVDLHGRFDRIRDRPDRFPTPRRPSSPCRCASSPHSESWPHTSCCGTPSGSPNPRVVDEHHEATPGTPPINQVRSRRGWQILARRCTQSLNNRKPRCRCGCDLLRQTGKRFGVKSPLAIRQILWNIRRILRG